MARFTQKLISQTKMDVKAELAGIQKSDIYAYINRESEKVEALIEDPTSQVRALVLSMSALVHHARFGGLKRHQINGLEKKVAAILKIYKVKSSKGSLSFLYDELDLILSQIDRKDGHHLHSAWRQAIVSHSGQVGDQAFADLSSGIRLLRLGEAKRAVLILSRAVDDAKTKQTKEKAWLLLMKGQRLSRQFDDAKIVQQHFRNSFLQDASEIGQKEYLWEEALLTLMRSGDSRALKSLLRRKQPHYNADYIMEYKLWAMALGGDLLYKKLPTCSTLYRHGRINLHLRKDLYELCATLEDFQDKQIPLRLRLRQIGNAMDQLPKILVIDHLLLGWAAIANLLQGIGHEDLETIAASEYKALCLRLTDGVAGDALAIEGPTQDQKVTIQSAIPKISA